MRELVLDCTQEQAQAWSDALLAAGALAVSIEDADSRTPREQALFGEPGSTPEGWQRSRLVALLAEGAEPQALLAALEQASGVSLAARDWHLRDVPDADWVRLTQAQFGPIQVGKRIRIVPSWHRGQEVPDPTESAAGLVRIELDPGLAFGTGSHATTHLCLEWLADHLAGGETVLDYGCGSGILAIAARLLGAGTTQGVDIDEQAVAAAARNARANQVDVRVCLPDDLAAGTYQVVLANILSGPLKVLAPMLCARVAAGGHLVLSGILERQADELIAAYAPWMALDVWAARDGWVCLAGGGGV